MVLSACWTEALNLTRDDSFVLQEVGGEAILVPTGQKVVDLNGLVTLNATGRFLWDCLSEPREVDELADLLCGEFEVDPVTARADAAAFVETLAGLSALAQ